MSGTIALALVSISLGAVGQFLLKVGVNKIGGFAFKRGELVNTAIKIATQPYIVIGIFLFVMSMVVWLAVLSKMELSRAYPMVSLSYAIVTILAALFLRERVGPVRIVGIVMVLVGVMVINLQ